MGVSFLIAVRGIYDLGRSLSAMPQPAARGSLVTSGMYRRIRHPLYADLVLLAVGYAVWRQSWVAMVLVAALMWTLMRKAACEERLLLKKYPDYAAYAQRAGFFLPKYCGAGSQKDQK
jgi:protein-S-isoprenylcysteine O-methyltransferase Ste14